MSTMTLEVPVVTRPAPKQTLTRAIRSEWIKIRTLRSTWYTLAATAVVLIGFGLIAAVTATGNASGSGQGGGFDATDPVGTVLTGANFAILVVGVMGALVGAREYSSGLIRTTLAAVPRRLPVLWGKVVGFSALIVPVVFVGVLVAFFAGTAILDGSNVTSASWSDPGVARAVLGTAAYVVGIGLIGLALGILLRGTASSIGTLIGGILFLPTVATALLPNSWDALLKYLPSNAGASFTSVKPDVSLLSPTWGVVVMAAWVVVAIAGAAVVLVRRDA